ERLGGLGLEPRNLIADRNRAASLHGAQLLDLGFEFGNRLFEVEIAAHRGDDLGFLRPESRRSPRPGRRFTSAFFNGKNGGPATATSTLSARAKCERVRGSLSPNTGTSQRDCASRPTSRRSAR